MKSHRSPHPLLVFTLAALTSASGADDLLIADFESETYADWKVEGEAFGLGPARGTLPGQMEVTGFEGKGLVNSFHQGDDTTGTLTSPPFAIQRPFINFLIGGGGYTHETGLDLLIDGKSVRSSTGPNTEPGGSEALDWASWEVAEFAGKEAVIRIVDARKGSWGHVNVDQITQGDTRRESLPATHTFTAAKRYLHLPVKTGAPAIRLKLLREGESVRELDIELCLDGKPSFLAALDLAPWQGESLTLHAGKVRDAGEALANLAQADELPNADGIYREALRPLFHFTSKIGWLNDPNGLVYQNGEWHLFYQHNPYGWNWGNMHWGHAVSKDLVHWQELGDAIYPWSDCVGAAFSGSAVIDHDNTSGFGKDGKVPLVAALTDTGAGEIIAFSNDKGRTLTMFENNPVVKHQGRDPKLIWYAPGGHWVMAVYNEFEGKQWIAFHTSPDLKAWEFQSRIEGYFECADLFELPVDGNSGETSWVLYAADGKYALGDFDGKKFTPAHEGKHQVWWGNFYAAQSYDNAPGGRRVQIGWGRDITFPGMPFNQQMVVPVELSLRKTAGAVRMFAEPVAELAALRGPKIERETPSLGTTPLRVDLESDAFEILVEGTVPAGARLTARVRGVEVTYDRTAKTLACGDKKAPLDAAGGKLALRILVDRGSLEVFANAGTVAISHGVHFQPDERTLEVAGEGVTGVTLTAFPLASVWQ